MKRFYALPKISTASRIAAVVAASKRPESQCMHDEVGRLLAVLIEGMADEAEWLDKIPAYDMITEPWCNAARNVSKHLHRSGEWYD